MTVNVDFPYHVDGRGRTADADADDHLRDLIEQVLFTAPGERVMRPDFGSGLLALVFEPGGPELVATTQFLVQGALQRELGHLIAVESVEVDAGRRASSRSPSRTSCSQTQDAHGRRRSRGARRDATRCCDERRLRAVKEAGVLNGIEYVEVSRLRGADRGAAPAHALRAAAAGRRRALDGRRTS